MDNCRSMIVAMLLETRGRDFKGNGWGTRHVEAWHEAVSTWHEAKGSKHQFERAIVLAVEALAGFADAHRSAYGSEIGDDGVLGDHWTDAAKAAIGMLNGEEGRLDCGTIDGLIRKLAKRANVDLE